MDNIAHTLAGFALARAGLSRGGRGTTVAAVIASNLPDADIVTAVFGTASYLEHHRGITHSVVGGPLLALALAGLLRLLFRGSRFVPLLVASLAGIAGHVFMDLWTTYGTRVLSPFDSTWYAWDLVFIVDPFVWAFLASAIAAEWALRRRGSPVAAQGAIIGLALLGTYVGARVLLHARALEETEKVLSVPEVRRMAALPSPIDPLYWKILVDAGPDLYSGGIDLRQGGRPLTRRAKRPEDAVVAQVRESSPAAAVFLDFSRFPWLEVVESPEGWTVSWRDLRFEEVPGMIGGDRSTRSPRRDGFVARVVLGPDGRIRSESIRF